MQDEIWESKVYNILGFNNNIRLLMTNELRFMSNTLLLAEIVRTTEIQVRAKIQEELEQY
jgi:hypothetical protein